MARTDLKIITASGNRKYTSTLTDVNPNATNAQLANLGSMFSRFTHCFYQQTNKVTTVHCDVERGKVEPTLELNFTVPTLATIQATTGQYYRDTTHESTGITTNSDGKLYARPAQDVAAPSLIVPGVLLRNNLQILRLAAPIDGWTGTDAQTFYIGVTETDTYFGKEITVEIK